MCSVDTPPDLISSDACLPSTAKAHQLLMNTLKTLSRVTRKLALHFALKPTATMIQAPSPTIETTTRANDHEPWKMNPMKRKIRRILPASWKLEEGD